MSGSFRAALVHALRFLPRRDVARLVVAALEDRKEPLVQWLLYGDAYPLILDELQCLHVAVTEASWTAASALFRKISIEQHGHTTAVSRDGSSPSERIAAVCRSLEYQFPESVMYRVIERGDLEHVQWLLTMAQYTTMEAIEYAAQARHVHLVQWLLDHIREGELLRCYLRYDESPTEARAIGWISQTDTQVHFSSISEKHGLVRRTQSLWDAEARIPDLPVAEPFAAAGDRLALEKLLLVRDPERVVSRFTVAHAPRGGHLEIVQWLHSLPLHEWSLAEAMIAASAQGHLDIVQWLFQFPETRIPDVMSQALEHNQLHVARWLRDKSKSAVDLSDYSSWVAAASSMNIAVFRFLHEEWGLQLDGTSILFMGISGDRLLMEYVMEKLLPAEIDGETIVFEAARKGTLNALQYLVETRGF